jgi:hypothetical protein
MSLDAQPSSLVASRSLKSFVQELDNYDPEDFLLESRDGTKEFEPESVDKYLRCIRGFLTSARARIIEAQLPTVKEQLAMLSAPIQQMNDHIFLLERVGKQTPEELRLFLTEKMKSLQQWREQIANLASMLESTE